MKTPLIFMALMILWCAFTIGYLLGERNVFQRDYIIFKANVADDIRGIQEKIGPIKDYKPKKPVRTR